METSAEEFVTLPYASNVACHAATFDGEPFLVMRFRLTDHDQEPGNPEHDRFVKFVVDRDSAQMIAHGLKHGIEIMKLSIQ